MVLFLSIAYYVVDSVKKREWSRLLPIILLGGCALILSAELMLQLKGSWRVYLSMIPGFASWDPTTLSSKNETRPILEVPPTRFLHSHRLDYEHSTCALARMHFNQLDDQPPLSQPTNLGLPDVCVWTGDGDGNRNGNSNGNSNGDSSSSSTASLLCMSNLNLRLTLTKDPVPQGVEYKNYSHTIAPAPDTYWRKRQAESSRFPVKVSLRLPRRLGNSRLSIQYNSSVQAWTGSIMDACQHGDTVYLVNEQPNLWHEMQNPAHFLTDVVTMASIVYSWQTLHIPKPTHVVLLHPPDEYNLWAKTTGSLVNEVFDVLRTMLDCANVTLITKPLRDMELCGVMIESAPYRMEWQWFVTPESVSLWKRFVMDHLHERNVTACDSRGNEIVIWNRRVNSRSIINADELAEELVNHFPSNPVKTVPTTYGEDLSTQIQRLCKARVILTGHGAQEALLAFLPSHIGLLELMPSSWHKRCFVGLHYNMGREFGFYLYNSSLARATNFHFSSENYSIIVEAVTQYVSS